MLRKYVLILSIAFTNAWRFNDYKYGVVDATLDVLTTAAGAPNFLVAGGEFYAKDWCSAFISIVAAISVFALSPATPIGALIAGTAMFLRGSFFELVTKWAYGSRINFLEILLRQIPRSLGTSLYVLLSPIPFGIDILFAVACPLAVSYYLIGGNLLSGLSSWIFCSFMSIRLLSGYNSHPFFVLTIMLLLVVLLRSIDDRSRLTETENMYRIFFSFISIFIYLCGCKNMFFMILAIIAFQLSAFIELRNE